MHQHERRAIAAHAVGDAVAVQQLFVTRKQFHVLEVTWLEIQVHINPRPNSGLDALARPARTGGQSSALDALARPARTG